MPEGPSILHLKNSLLTFKGKIVKHAGGYNDMPTAWINGEKLLDICTWGKHLLFVFTNGTVRVHLGLFGDVLINKRKQVNRSFFLEFAKGEINGYVVRTKKLEKAPKDEYDWRALYRAGVHPLSITGKIPAAQISRLIKEVVKYAEIFYNELETTGTNKSFAVYQQDFAADGSEVTMKVLTKSRRKIFFSEHRQVLYT